MPIYPDPPVKRHKDKVNSAGTRYQAFSVRVEGRRAQPKLDRATEVPPEQQAETLERESRPVLEEETLGSREPESFADFPAPLDNYTDDDLPF